MPDSDRTHPGTDATEPAMDFTGLAAAAAYAFKPDFADVAARAARRRRKRAFGAVFLALGLAAGGGTTFAVTADRSPAPVRPAPSPSVGPWRTAVAQPGVRGPAPQPSYTEIEPGRYDPTARDKPLTGMFTELRAGDLDHLYLPYQDCAGKNCRQMLAASADRGRTWRKLPLPKSEHQPFVALVHGSLVLAQESDPPPEGSYDPRTLPDPTYWSSTDGGVTWRRPAARTAEALPAGWPVRMEDNAVVAFDPATGDPVRVRLEVLPRSLFLLDTPPGAGMWALSTEDEPMPSPRPTGPVLGRSRAVAKVSTDGGRSWETRELPEFSRRSADGSVSLDHSMLYTADGRTVYVREQRGDSVRIHASTDGGRTWEARAVVDLDGPMLSLLPVGDRTVIVEGRHGTYRSTDQGRTFTRVGPSLGSRAHAIPGGYAIATNNNEYSLWLSPDGAEWTYIRRPEVP
ncbi:hypothetical protein DMB66_49675 [Actinoplanes sp. ATCC 53533]|uniref:sialidase family protein n=1 Tax=Actinoplanes sp. ATCC 53533 TaxID=1288362 RepID=UPI000F77BC18|nr:sialidase family protein [Actinoplanes sp. ATCC 53533]RSM46497.1 hypothetical protein DMB66_49675 [Actinoplanes sp. ATCC 53533]